MLPNARVCLYPRDPAEAVRVMVEHGKRALVMAGGTTTAMSKDPGFDTLIDLTRMGCDRIELVGGEWRIGCNVRLHDLGVHPGIRKLWSGVLSDAARAVGSRPLRNAITLGGNVVGLFRWSDTPVALLAMDAVFDLVGPDGTRSLEADAFFARHPRQVMQAGELLAGVRIASDDPHGCGAFCKYARTEVDLAVVDVAACLQIDEQGRCSKARIAVGGTRAVPWRAEQAEKKLLGSKLTRRTIESAAATAKQEGKVLSDVRTDRDYRERMIEVIAGRTIERAAASCKERG
ncbi:MAG: FAD binding domain-containing protein [Deltaproteobacteria bacterium]|nr:FAD binding domain-containing protein [Deltaproteobacteria bacterium]